MKDLERRLSRLEGGGSRDEIAIWTEEESQMPAFIDQMIADGELTEADRSRCVHWSKSKGRPGGHEEALKELD
jgi:hypothetical protein